MTSDPSPPSAGPPTATVVLGSSSAAAPASDLPRGTSVGRYLVLDRLGAGGMGVVYLGYDPELDRKVALKLLRPEKTGSLDGAWRLQREAQAIARLSHPHVVAVYDVGTWSGQVFVAMEPVEGRTLRAWLAEERRPWRGVLEVFRAAGEGLAAAHAAGLAHRDFKPDNVLIGRDGGVKVVDFGLARALPEEASAPSPAEVPEGEGPGSIAEGTEGGEGGTDAGSRSRLSEPLTEWGVAAGTPAYMSSEQRRGLPADARSDQYSFCVALWEALYGSLPPAGSAREVPGWLRQALLRGLADDPAARFRSMDELLAALGRDPALRRRRRRILAAAVLGIAGLAAGAVAWQAWRVRLCQGGEAEIARAWNGRGRMALRAAFAATGLAYAGETAQRVEAILDRYANGWAFGYRRACQAARLEGRESAELLDRRRLCLDQRRDELAALVQLFAEADAATVAKAVDAAGGLGDLHACTESAALAAVVPLPHDAGLRRRVAREQARLARVKALQAAGKPQPALALAERAATECEGLPYRPLQAAASFRLADSRETAGDFKGAEEELYRTLRLAEEGRDDLRKAEAWKKLAYTVGYRLGRPQEARRYLEQARAALRRAGGSPAVEAQIESSAGAIDQALGRFAAAEAAYRRELALERLRGEGDDYVTLTNLASISQLQGESARAERDLRTALAAAERELGPSHPTVASMRYNLGLVLADLGRFAESDAELAASLGLRERLFGRSHADVAESLSALGANWTRRGDARRALPLLERAEAISTSVAPDSLNALLARQNLGDALRMLGRWEEAERAVRSALAGFEGHSGAGGAYVALPLLTLGQMAIERGRPERAVPLLLRAEAILAGDEALRSLLGAARFRRAQALWDLGADRPAALALARSAREELLAAGPPAREDLAAAEAWLAGLRERSGKGDG